MVSNDLLLHIHFRLTEIFASKGNFPFAGITVFAVGDFLQLPPVEYKNTWHNLDSLRGLFKITELTEVMRQQGDNKFINLLNHVDDLDD